MKTVDPLFLSPAKKFAPLRANFRELYRSVTFSDGNTFDVLTASNRFRSSSGVVRPTSRFSPSGP
jgi:hypothetical protein